MQNTFRELLVWQKGLELAKQVYTACNTLPRSEEFGLKSQMCRAAISIPSNIAEGQRRGTRRDFAQFLRIAYGSSAELETQIAIAESVYPAARFMPAKQLLEEVQKMLPVLIRKITASANN